MKPFLVRIALAGALALLTGFALLYILINEKHELIPESLARLARKADLLENPEAKRCGECHQAIYEAWQKSRHSKAWTSETYIKDSENRSKEKCLPCHIPRVVKAGNKPEPRLSVRDDGIYCVPCHVAGGKMNGPYALFSPPHPTERNDDYRKAVFCGSCHEKTYKEWQAAGASETCQSCHMARARGRLVQNRFLKFLHAPKEVAYHSFPHGKIGPKEIALNVGLSRGRVQVTLKNETVPHLVPTADNGDPRLYLTVSQFDAAGEQLDRVREILAPQQETALAYKKAARFRYPLDPGAKQLIVLLEYKPAWSKEKSLVLEKSYAIDF